MKKAYFWILVLSLALNGCATRVSTSFDRQADFNRYKTFCWLQGCEFTFTGPGYMNDSAVVSNLKNAIIKEMEEKGFVYDAENPDLLLDFHVTVENRQTNVYRFEEDRFLQLDPVDQSDVYYFLEGTLIMDIADRETGQMIWRSSASRYLELNPEMTEKNLRRGIGIVLKKFPPKDKSGM
ncbi:DUF4136 domain-containing protein [uncultured Imperialibacter sp.]|uniref:DUF4136 domain-containing protein n=1 Tax=uncultured Imperialibacter sp. TaxID=1672639 RepID=UPI0030DB2976|tara:strand:+ start:4099 stop:4638 length:540 start_codon:yes stop_codon:yes gene_type:complete